MNPQFKRNLIGVAVASCFAGTAYGNPIGPAVVNGSVGFGTAGKTLTVTNSPGAIINWQSFSIAADEATRFIQQSAASSVLNRVVGVDPSAILGLLQSNGRVFLINPNGLLFGASARIDVPGFVASTLDISNADFLNGRFNFAETAGAAGIKNEGSITTSTGGFVYLVATDIENTGIITSPQGEVILAAGKSVELVNPGSPDIRVVLTAPDNQALNVGAIVAKSGRIGIYGGLIRQQGTVNANTVVRGKNGEIIFKATKDITFDRGSVTTASGEGRGVKDGGEVRIIADGTLNVKAGSEVHVDGGPKGGNGGFLELSGKQLSLNGEYTGRAQPGYKGGSLLLDPDNIEIVTGGAGLPGSSTSTESFFQIDPLNLDYGGFADVSLAADNTLRVLSPISNADINGGAAGGSLTLNAGSLVLVDAPIGTSGTRFDHDLSLRSQNDVTVQNSIFLGNRTLKLEADVPVATLGAAFGAYGDGIGSVLITPYGGPVTVSTLGNINVNAPVMGVFGGSGPGQSVKVSAGNDININLTGSTCLLGECGAFGVIGGMGNGAFAEVTAGNDIKILATALSDANVAVWGGGGSGAYGKLRAGNDLVLDLQPGPGASFVGGEFDVLGGGGNNAYAEASAGRNIKSWDLDPNVSGGLNFGEAATTIGYVTVEGGSASGPYGGASISAGNITATLSAGYDAAGVPRTDGQGSISLDLAYGAEVLGGTVDHFLYGAEGSPSISTDASALMRAAKNITLTVAGTGGPAVMIEGGSAFAGVTNAASGTAIASATADATVLAYGGAVSITVTNGGINLSGGDAAAEAFHSGAGTANHQATAQAKTKVSAATNVTLDAQNGTVNIHGGIAGAHAGHDASDATGTFSGNDTATATTGLEIKGGAASTVSLHGAYGANIDAGYGGAFAFKYQAASGVTMSGANTASAYGGLSISGGSISITADSGPIKIFAPAALAIATHWLDNATGANVTGNNKAYAEFNLALTASGATSIEIDAGANSVQLGGGSSIYVDDFPQPFSLPRGAMARAEHNVFGGSDNSLSGNNDATAKAATSFLASAGPVTISGGVVTLKGAPTLAVAAQQVKPFPFGAPALKATLSGNDTASATGSFSISGYGGVSITGANGVSAYGAYGAYGGSAQASAFQHVDTNHSTVLAANQASSLTGVQTAGAASSFSIAAPNGSLSIAAPSGVVTIDGGEGNADAHQFAQENNGSTGPTLSHTLSGSQSATGAASMTLSAKNNLAISAYGGVDIDGEDARADAYQSAYTNHNSTSYGAFVGHQLTAASQSAIATNSLSFSGATVSVSAGSLSINGGSADANAYQQAEGYNAYGGVTGHQLTVGTLATPATQTATATNGLAITATGGGITISAPNGSVNISGSSASADARQEADLNNTAATSTMGAGHVLTGNQSATANNTLSLSATGDIQITAGYGASLGLSKVAWASASQDASETRSGYGGTLGHQLTGNQSANAATQFTISGANITVDGGYGDVTVEVVNGFSSDVAANAVQRADVDNGNYFTTVYGGVIGHTLTGNQSATTNAKVKLTATGDITLTSPYGGDVQIRDYGSASASASQDASILDYGIGGTGHKLSGNQTANAASAIELTAGGTLILSAANGSIDIYSSEGDAEAEQRAYTNHYGMNGNFAGSTLTGNQSATATSKVSLSGANIAVNGANGVDIYNDDSASASASQFATGYNAYGAVVGHKLTGDPTANAVSEVKLIAGTSLSVTSAYGGISVNGSSADADASQYAYLNGVPGAATTHTLSGNPTATAKSSIVLSAGTGDLTLQAYGGVSLNGSSADANAEQRGQDGAKLSGSVSAAADSEIKLSAGGGIKLYGNSININGDSASASAFQYASDAVTNVSGTVTAKATSDITLAANGNLELTATVGSVSLDATSYASASAYQYAYGSGVGTTLSGANTAEATSRIKLSAGGNLTLSGAYANIDGASSGSARAYQYVYGEKATVSGANSATSTMDITLAAGGDLTVTTIGGLSVDGGSDYEASARQSVFGSNHTVSGANTATTNAKVALSAGGTMKVNGPLSVYAASTSSNHAYQKVNGAGNTVNGTNASTMNLNVALSAGTMELSTVNLNGDSATHNHAYQEVSGAGHTVGGSNTVNTATTLTLTATGAMTIASGGLDISASEASAKAYRSADTGNTVSGANSATAESDMEVTAGSLTVTSGDVSVNGYLANAYTSGAGDNRAEALSFAGLGAGTLTINSGGLYLNGGAAYATHNGSGTAAPVAYASAIMFSGGLVNVSGDVFLSGGSAYTFTSGAGAPEADASTAILVIGSGAKTMTIGGSLGLFGGITGVTGAAGTPSAFALIDPGQLTITTITGNIDLIGGDGVDTFAGLHAYGPVVLNIGGDSLNIIGGPGSGLFAGTGSNITVSFTNATIESPGAINVDNTCLTCGDALVLTESTATAFVFTPPPESFRPQESPETPDDKKKTTVSGDDQRGTQEDAQEDEGLPTCS